MKDQATFARKVLVALGAGIFLIFGAVITRAALPFAPSGSSPAQTTASAGHPSHVVLHGVRFDSKTGQLDDGSKAVLDYAAELLKADPDAMVSVDQRYEEDPNGACGLTPAQTQAVASHIEERGIPAARLMLCQATPSSAMPAQR